MKQNTYRINGREEFMNWAGEIKNSEDYLNAKEVLFKVLTSQLLDEEIKDLYYQMKNLFPEAKVAGVSMTNFVGKKLNQNLGGSPVWAKKLNDMIDNYAVISCCYFDSADIEVIEVDSSEVDNLIATAMELNSHLKNIPDLKGVEVLEAGGKERIALFLEWLSKGLEDIPFFGAEAGSTDLPTQVDKNTCQFHNVVVSMHPEKFNVTTPYVAGSKVHKAGVILVLYSGKDLHMKAEYNFGWKPLGKEMRITETLGINGVSKIDNVPAIEIYKKYLNIEPNKFLIFNVFDFPFVVNRGGIDAARVAAIYDESGRLYMTGDVKQGEKIRLSYGNPEEILKQTWESSERMRKFEPQGIFTYVCGARTVFLGSDSKRELKDFIRIVPNTVYCFGGGEIYKHHGKGGQLATALVAVGIREGEGCSCFEKMRPQYEHVAHLQTAPLSKRLAAFLEATTNDLKESKEKFKEAALAAESASKAKTQFLSNMSHEIRTPINAILGMNEMILREASDKNILEYAENIRTAGNTLLGLVNDILDFSKIEAGKMEIIDVEYSLSSLLNDLVNMIQGRAAKKGLTFHINAAYDLPSELFGDEIRIKQVVTNILTNAVKYTEHGSVTLTVNSTKISEDKIKMFFSVKDTGIGIKQEDISKLFSAFERIEEKRNRAVEGTGLGMNITQRLLNMMGSSLNVTSVYGEGSEFSFEIEQKVLNDHPLGDFEESFRHSLSQHKKYREKFIAPDAKILVVDDTVMNLTVVKGLLKQTKVQIDTAESGYECLNIVSKKHYDLIFLDHRMPGIDGIETLERMKKMHNNLNQDTPVISLTANAISGARKQYIDAGFQDYLTKPIDSTKLEQMMIDYLPTDKVKIIGEDEQTAIEDNETALPDWLSNVEGLNTADGIEHCGSVDLYLDALTVFAQSVTSGVAEITNFYKAADWKNYTTKVHALKSSARVVGANELSERARRLETAGINGYINEITDSTDGLLELYISFAAKLAPLLKNDDDDSNKPLIDEDQLSEAYEALREFSASFDYDSVMFVIQSVEEYRLPDDEKDKFSQIKSAASKPDWETLSKLVA